MKYKKDTKEKDEISREVKRNKKVLRTRKK